MIEVKNLSITCCGRKIISDLSFKVTSQTVTSIVGPSGVGKTTILKSMNRMLEERPEYDFSGDVLFDDKPLARSAREKYELRRRVGLVFQKPTIFPISTYKNVIFGVKHIKAHPKREFEQLAEKCLKDVGLWDEVKDRLHDSALKLSIGQQQRLAIARTLAVGSEVLLMDEPTSSLDLAATARIEQLMQDLGRWRTVILVTHDLRQAIAISDQIVRLVPSDQGATGVLYRDKQDFGRIEAEMRADPRFVLASC